MNPEHKSSSHAAMDAPSAWVLRWAGLVPAGGAVLDVACGGGRHARLFAGRGHPVEAVDRDARSIAALNAVSGVKALCADIEADPWPYAGRQFSAVVVTNYLHRPLLPLLLESVAAGGVLIYETFAVGNEAYGRPSNPDFLLRPGELRALAGADWQVAGYEQVFVETPRAAVLQRICALAPSR